MSITIQLRQVIHTGHELQYFSLYDGTDGPGVTAHFTVTSANMTAEDIYESIEENASLLPEQLRYIGSAYFRVTVYMFTFHVFTYVLRNAIVTRTTDFTFRFVDGSVVVPSTRELFFEIDAHLSTTNDSINGSYSDIAEELKALVTNDEVDLDSLSGLVDTLLTPYVENVLRLTIGSPR